MRSSRANQINYQDVAQVLVLALIATGCSTAPSVGGSGGKKISESGESSSQNTPQTTATDTEFVDQDGDGIDDREQQVDFDGDGDGHPDCVPGVLGTTQVPRLKNVEYDRTLRDLVGVEGLTEAGGAEPSSLLATDQDGSISDLGWSSYQTVAEMVAKQVMTDPSAKAKFLLCDPAVAGCIDSTITEFGRRAFRRPLVDAEVGAFKALAVSANTPNGAPDEVAELLLYGFLISPSFLMRSEINETQAESDTTSYVLSPFEVASRLSYMLWGSMPDPSLSAAADTKQLAIPEQILAQAQRMLLDPKARDMVAEFHQEYLRMGVNTRWDTFVKEPTRYPAFNEGLRPVLRAETEMFFDKIVFGNGGFQDFFLSTQVYVNAETAALYGADPAGLGTDLQAMDLPDRPGFLTRLGFLNVFSQASRTSPILRGAYIIKDVLGANIGTPPPGAGSVQLPDSPDLKTNRARVDAQTSDAACTKCHQRFINPAGFVMEAFDTMGAYQTQEVDNGEPIDSSAEVMIDGAATPTSGPVQLMSLLASSKEAQYFYTEKWVSHAFDRDPNSRDACSVELLSARLAQEEYTILDLIADITQTETFSVRALETGVAQ